MITTSSTGCALVLLLLLLLRPTIAAPSPQTHVQQQVQSAFKHSTLMRASRAATTTNGRPHLVYPALRDGQSLRTGQLPDDSSDELLLVQLSMNGETHLLSLLPDDPSVSDDFFVRTVFADDEELRETTLERCFYRGTVNRDAASFVSVSLCGSRQHLHGFYLYKGTRYAISPLNPKDDQGRNDGINDGGSERTLGLHQVQSIGRYDATALGCAGGPATPTKPSVDEARDEIAKPASNAAELANATDKLPQIPEGARQQPVTVKVLLVADSSMVEVYGDNTANWVTGIFTGADALFASGDEAEKFFPPIRLELASVEVWRTNLASITTDGPQSLINFCAWAASQRYAQVDYDVALLLTFNNLAAAETDIVGLAFVATACTEAGCAVIEDLGPRAQAISSQTVAHETGHSLGAGHDGIDNTCEAGKYIMSSVQSGSTQWSDCSGQEISTFVSDRFLNEEFCRSHPVDLTNVTNGSARTAALSIGAAFAVAVAALFAGAF